MLNIIEVEIKDKIKCKGTNKKKKQDNAVERKKDRKKKKKEEFPYIPLQW